VEPNGNGDMVIEDEEPPLFGGDRVWALLNLLLTIAGVILTIVLVVRLLIQNRRDREDEERAYARQRNQRYRGENEVYRERPKRRFRILPIILVPTLALLAAIIFLITQDMRLRMVLVDWWTIAHVLIFMAALLCYLYAIRYGSEVDEYEYEDVDNGQPQLME